MSSIYRCDNGFTQLSSRRDFGASETKLFRCQPSADFGANASIANIGASETKLYQFKCFVKIEDGKLYIPNFDRIRDTLLDRLRERSEPKLHMLQELIEYDEYDINPEAYELIEPFNPEIKSSTLASVENSKNEDDNEDDSISKKVKDELEIVIKNETSKENLMNTLSKRSLGSPQKENSLTAKNKASKLAESSSTYSKSSNDEIVAESSLIAIEEPSEQTGFGKPSKTEACFNHIDSRLQNEDHSSRRDIDKLFMTATSEHEPQAAKTNIYEEKASHTLGDEGEQLVFKQLQRLFPTFETRLVSSIAHVADIHLIDENRCFVFEIKNKSSVSNDDLVKFDSDLATLRSKNDMQYIGVFISLRSPIVKFGKCFIANDRCYLAQEYANDECLKLVIDMYRNIICKTRSYELVETKKFEIPANVYTLISRLRAEYSTLNSNRDYYTQQLEFNRKSSGLMNELLARVDVQLHFIDFINKEFAELPTVDVPVNEDEERLKEYLKTNRKPLKRELLIQFPSLTCIRNMSMKEIKERYMSKLE